MSLLAMVCCSTATAYTESPPPVRSSAESVATDWLQGGWWIMPLGLVAALLFWSSRGARLGRLPRFPWTFSPGTGYTFVLLTLIAGAVAAQIVLAVAGTDPESPEQSVRALTILQLVSLSAMGAVLLAMPGWWRRPPGQEDTRPSFLVSAGVGFVTLVIFFPMVQSILLGGTMLRVWFTGEPPPDFAHRTLVLLDGAGDDGWRWGLMALIVFAVPVVEETIYRGLLQESLRRHRTLTNGSAWMSIVITSVLFALMHGGVATTEGLVSLFVLSLGLGWVHARTGRLIAPVIMHAGYNAVNLLLASLS